MGRKRKSKVATQLGWEDLKEHHKQKSWKLNPNCPENIRREVLRIERLRKLEEAKEIDG